MNVSKFLSSNKSIVSTIVIAGVIVIIAIIILNYFKSKAANDSSGDGDNINSSENKVAALDGLNYNESNVLNQQTYYQSVADSLYNILNEYWLTSESDKIFDIFDVAKLNPDEVVYTTKLFGARHSTFGTLFGFPINASESMTLPAFLRFKMSKDDFQKVMDNYFQNTGLSK